MSAFTFGAPSGSNPAPSGGFGFGSGTTPAALAPAFGFGASAAAPAPAGSLFGGAASTPAPPAPGAFNFGGGTTNLFGAASAPSSSSSTGGGGGLFGASPAPAPGSVPGFGFASTTPAPAPVFGSSFTAPAPFGSPSLQQQQQQQPFQQQQQQQQQTIAGTMPYASLPPDIKQAIDSIHQAILRHKRTMLSLQSAGPQLLQKSSASDQKTPLQERAELVHCQLQQLQQDMNELYESTDAQMKATEKTLVDTTMYALWPVEELAVRKNVRLTAFPTAGSTTSSSSTRGAEEKKSEPDSDSNTQALQQKIRQALQQGLAAVDQITRIPSPYYWHQLHELETRALQMKEQIDTIYQQRLRSQVLQQRLQQPGGTTAALAYEIETQHLALRQVEGRLQELSHFRMEQVRHRYTCHERGEHVLEHATAQELERQRRINEQVLLHYLQAAAEAAAPGSAPAPGSLMSFGSTTTTGSTTAAPLTGFGFGTGSNSSTTPAPTGGGLFGSTATAATTPAPAGAFSFGATTPTAAGSGTSLFGSSPALFSPAAAPTTTAGGFGGFASATTTVNPSTKKKSGSSRSGGRLKK